MCKMNYESPLQFGNEWLLLLQEECEREENIMCNVKPMQTKTRIFIWNICKRLDIMDHGVAGVACQLFERFMYNVMLIERNAGRGDDRMALLDSLMSKFILNMISCIQLAAKMSNSTTCINAVIRMELLRMGFSYSKEEINETESEVFQSIGYDMPLWSAFDMAIFLCDYLGFPAACHKPVAIIVDIAECHRNVINEKVIWAAHLPSSSQSPSVNVVRTLHLAAGAVVAMVNQLRVSHPTLQFGITTLDLANLLQLSESYLICISDVILEVITTTTITSKTRHKRKAH